MLTVKQKEVLDAVIYLTNQLGYPPTIREISALLKCNIRQVFDKLMILEDKGYISTVNSRSRSIKVLKQVEE